MKKQLISLIMILTLVFLILPGCSSKKASEQTDVPVVGNLKYDHSMDVEYAENFQVDYYKGGYALLSITNNNTKFLVVPEGKETPENLADDISVLKRPISNVYLVAPSIMVFFTELDSLDMIRLSGTRADAWYVPEAAEAMNSGKILFAGKYSEPDYELITSNNCTLSIQSGMITHAPDVQEKLEELGITVMVDQSSYESHPLGRTEWMKFYSVLVGKEELAEELFNEQAKILDELAGTQNTGKTVAFFYVTSAGTVSARNSNDYVPKMIELAGGKYIFDNLGDPSKALSTTQMSMEDFYAGAKDADYIIYNSTIDGNVTSIQDLLAKNELFADFKAVKDGNVWCTNQNLYQDTNKMGETLGEIHTIITDGNETKLTHFYKLK